MRTFFLVLLLANLALFAWWRYLSPADSGLDRQPLARQIEPEKLKIVPPAELAKLAAEETGAAAAPGVRAGARPCGSRGCLPRMGQLHARRRAAHGEGARAARASASAWRSGAPRRPPAGGCSSRRKAAGRRR